jgi:hypothetical protein
LDTIGDVWLEPESHVFRQILRTCKQLLQEGLPILYGKNNFKDYFHINHVQYGYKDFSEEFLRTIGENNRTVMNNLWLPGSTAVPASESSHRAKKTYMDLRGLLKKHPSLCHIRLLVFEQVLFDHGQGDRGRIEYELDDYRFEDILDEHLDILGIKQDWDDAIHKFGRVDSLTPEGHKKCLKVKDMAQEANRSMFTTKVLGIARIFRAECRDPVRLCETEYPSDRRLLLS